jgi:hypothetical protein
MIGAIPPMITVELEGVTSLRLPLIHVYLYCDSSCCQQSNPVIASRKMCCLGERGNSLLHHNSSPKPASPCAIQVFQDITLMPNAARTIRQLCALLARKLHSSMETAKLGSCQLLPRNAYRLFVLSNASCRNRLCSRACQGKRVNYSHSPRLLSNTSGGVLLMALQGQVAATVPYQGPVKVLLVSCLMVAILVRTKPKQIRLANAIRKLVQYGGRRPITWPVIAGTMGSSAVLRRSQAV